MDLNANIIDARVSAIMGELRERARSELGVGDDGRLRSVAFLHLCVKTMLDFDDEQAFDCIVEGGQDFGLDAIHASEERDGEFTVTLFQSKYKTRLEGTSNFPEDGIAGLLKAIRYLFDPAADLQNLNQRLLSKVEEVRSLIREGFIPSVRAVACNNGQKWNDAAQELIDLAKLGNQVSWEHVNHDKLVQILSATKPVNDRLQLVGKALVEDMNFSRVLVGRIEIEEIAALIERHGERLLERNIRRYLGLMGNRVNEAIRDTLNSESDSGNFYFYNNGITLTCDKFSYNALQGGDYSVQLQNLQIINGGQTCMTIAKTLRDEGLVHVRGRASVLVRLYQLPSENEDLVRRITFATNSQNPVDLRDLRANDQVQQRLELDLKGLGYTYRRKRTEQSLRPTDITTGTAAEAVLSVWRERPHQAKFFAREHFGKLYDLIFKPSLTGTEVVVAVLLYRVAENRRKRPRPGDEDFVPYASCFIAMQMGRRLMGALDKKLPLTHQHIQSAVDYIDSEGEALFEAAKEDVAEALRRLYGDRDISLQQLSATFRRADLIEILTRLGGTVAPPNVRGGA